MTKTWFSIATFALCMITTSGCKPKKIEDHVFLDPLPKQWPNAHALETPDVPAPPRIFDPYYHVWIADSERTLEMLREDTPIKKGVICIVTVKRDGVISDLKIKKGSGSPANDKLALDLIAKAAPFKFLRSEATFLAEFYDSTEIRLTRVKKDQE
jgi:hypothetical protein